MDDVKTIKLGARSRAERNVQLNWTKMIFGLSDLMIKDVIKLILKNNENFICPIASYFNKKLTKLPSFNVNHFFKNFVTFERKFYDTKINDAKNILNDIGNGLSLFNYACKSGHMKIIKEFVDFHPKLLYEFKDPNLVCSNFDVLTRYYPNLAEIILSNLPYRAFNATDLNELEENCPICREPTEIGDKWIRLKCTHQFHEKCLYNWIERQRTCPMCRIDIILPPLNNNCWI